MVTITIEEQHLILHVNGIAKILALKSELAIPFANIKGVTADPGVLDLPRGIRAPGTAIPGIIYAGTFVYEGDKVFWDVHNPAKAIVIELSDEGFSRLIVEVEDVETTVRQIETAINLQ